MKNSEEWPKAEVISIRQVKDNWVLIVIFTEEIKICLKFKSCLGNRDLKLLVIFFLRSLREAAKKSSFLSGPEKIRNFFCL